MVILLTVYGKEKVNDDNEKKSAIDAAMKTFEEFSGLFKSTKYIKAIIKLFHGIIESIKDCNMKRECMGIFSKLKLECRDKILQHVDGHHQLFNANTPGGASVPGSSSVPACTSTYVVGQNGKRRRLT